MRKVSFIFFAFFIFCPCFSDFYKTNVTVSYYAEDFHGKKTSSGETFNMYDFTCAHKMLPFGTKVKVTNIQNGKSVVVRVNDRGPFVKTREMDLSKAAAAKLGMIKSGTAKVNLEIISIGESTGLSEKTARKACKIAGIVYSEDFSNGIKAQKSSDGKSSNESLLSKSPVVRTSDSEKAGGSSPFWDIQIGAFSSRENANRLAQKLLNDGFSDVVFQTRKNDDSVVRVVIRKVPSGNLEEVEKSLKLKGYAGYVIKKRNF